MAVWARSRDIGAPYGMSNGISSGTKSRGFRSVICCTALVTDIDSPSLVALRNACSFASKSQFAAADLLPTLLWMFAVRRRVRLTAIIDKKRRTDVIVD